MVSRADVRSNAASVSRSPLPRGSSTWMTTSTMLTPAGVSSRGAAEVCELGALVSDGSKMGSFRSSISMVTGYFPMEVMAGWVRYYSTREVRRLGVGGLDVRRIGGLEVKAGSCDRARDAKKSKSFEAEGKRFRRIPILGETRDA